MDKINCLDCPDDTRGLCCYINMPLKEFNIVLENQPCPLLDLETKLCSDYKNRKKNIPYCLHGENKFGHGGLPEGCLYLKDNPELEPNPKIKILSIIDKIHPQVVGFYNYFNNLEYSDLEKYLVKSEVTK